MNAFTLESKVCGVWKVVVDGNMRLSDSDTKNSKILALVAWAYAEIHQNTIVRFDWPYKLISVHECSRTIVASSDTRKF